MRTRTCAIGLGRKTREDELETGLTAWIRERNGAELEAALIGVGIASHVVQNSAECWADPQLAHRERFIPVKHTRLGEVICVCLSGDGVSTSYLDCINRLI